MKKFHGKSFIAVFLIVSVFLGSVPVMAESAQAIDVVFGRVKLVVNGQAVDKDTLLYDGVTYVPLRDAAEALEMEVFFDSSSSTAFIDPPGTGRENSVAQQSTVPDTSNAGVSADWSQVSREDIENYINSLWYGLELDSTLTEDAHNFMFFENWVAVSYYYYQDLELEAESFPILVSEGYKNLSESDIQILDIFLDGIANGIYPSNKDLAPVYELYLSLLATTSGISAHRASILAGADPELDHLSEIMIEGYWEVCAEIMEELKIEGAKYGLPLGNCMFFTPDLIIN